MAGLIFNGKTPKKSSKAVVVKSDMLSRYEGYIEKVSTKVNELKDCLDDRLVSSYTADTCNIHQQWLQLQSWT